uniref:Uncharacterized protein n=1 Tax=Timspurckia oligopyrenoides TaxID=708627 RepID=A0A7S1EQ72_9RHOD|mmetsp:Transcript_12220/g.22092  ORF Transcript_12220/g.22092 Transcript_12220/m.22092 type:complete len:520 (+) Transcript_12220:879-2438(+)
MEYTLPADKELGVVLLQREQLSSRHAHHTLELNATHQHILALHNHASVLQAALMPGDSIMSLLYNLREIFPPLAVQRETSEGSLPVSSFESAVAREISAWALFFHGDLSAKPPREVPREMLDVLSDLLSRVAWLIERFDLVGAKALSIQDKTHSRIWKECVDLHATMRNRKQASQTLRNQEVALRNQALRLEADLHTRTDLLTQWDAQLKELDDRLPNESKLTAPAGSGETGKAGDRDGEALNKSESLQPGATIDSEAAEEANGIKKENLIAAIKDFQASQAIRESNTKASLVELSEIVKEASAAATEILGPVASGTYGYSGLSRRDILHSALYKHLEGDVQTLLVSDRIRTIDTELFTKFESIVGSTVESSTRVWQDAQNERFSSLSRLAAEAVKASTSAVAARERIESQLAQKSKKDEQRLRESINLARYLSNRTDDIRYIEQNIEKLRQLRQQAQDVRRAYGSSIAEDNSAAKVRFSFCSLLPVSYRSRDPLGTDEWTINRDGSERMFSSCACAFR